MMRILLLALSGAAGARALMLADKITVTRDALPGARVEELVEQLPPFPARGVTRTCYEQLAMDADVAKIWGAEPGTLVPTNVGRGARVVHQDRLPGETAAIAGMVSLLYLDVVGEADFVLIDKASREEHAIAITSGLAIQYDNSLYQHRVDSADEWSERKFLGPASFCDECDGKLTGVGHYGNYAIGPCSGVMGSPEGHPYDFDGTFREKGQWQDYSFLEADFECVAGDPNPSQCAHPGPCVEIKPPGTPKTDEDFPCSAGRVRDCSGSGYCCPQGQVGDGTCHDTFFRPEHLPLRWNETTCDLTCYVEQPYWYCTDNGLTDSSQECWYNQAAAETRSGDSSPSSYEKGNSYTHTSDCPVTRRGRHLLQDVETYEPTTLTPAPTTGTYEPSTQTYAPSATMSIVVFSLDVFGTTPEAVLENQGAWQRLGATFAGAGVAAGDVVVRVDPGSTRRLEEGAQLRGGRRALQGTPFGVDLEIGLETTKVGEVEKNLMGASLPAIQEFVDAQGDIPAGTAVVAAETREEGSGEGATHSPTASPVASSTAQPSAKPSAAPSAEPSAKPSAKPSAAPSAEPSAKPSAKPSAAPSAKPSAAPSMTPTGFNGCCPIPPG